jgi:phenylacetate-CoA ligase
MIWNQPIECMDRQQLTELQGKRLAEMIQRIYYNIPFYRNKMQESGIEPGDR